MDLKAERRHQHPSSPWCSAVLAWLYVYPMFMILFNSFKKETAITTSHRVPAAHRRTPLPALAELCQRHGLQGLSTELSGYSPAHHRHLGGADPSLLLHVRLVHHPGKGPDVSKALYYLFVFSMVVPFQMVMFTLSQTADILKPEQPPGTSASSTWASARGWRCSCSAGFMKSIPLEIEEAAMIDGCNPLQTFFLVVLPILKPTLISVAILEAMWVWNDYLLPTLVLDIKKYTHHPHAHPVLPRQLRQSGDGPHDGLHHADRPAHHRRTTWPCQKHIIEGVVAGAVKG